MDNFSAKNVDNQCMASGDLSPSADMGDIQKTASIAFGDTTRNKIAASIDKIKSEISDREMVERLLMEIHDLYQNLYNNAQIGLFRARISNGQLLECNEFFAKLVGHDSVEECKASWIATRHYVDLEALQKIEVQLQTTGEVKNAEARFRRKNGEIAWIRFSAKAFPLEGFVEGFCSVITEEKQVQERIRQLARFPDENPSPILRISHEGTILYANNASSPLLKAWNRGPGGVIPDPLRQQTAESLKMSSNREFEIECEGRVFSLILTPVAEASYINIYGRDITERKRAEQQLEIERAYLQQLFDSAPEAIVVVDNDSKLIRINGEFTRMFGYDAQEAIGRSVDELLSPESVRQDALSLTRRIIAGEKISVESVRFRKDGTPVQVSIMGAPINVDGGQIAVYGIYRDITSRKCSERMRDALFQISEATSLAGNLEDLLKTVYEILGTLIDTTNFYVALYDPDKEVYSFPYHVETDGKEDFSTRPLRKRVTDYVRRTGEPLLAKRNTFDWLKAKGELEYTRKLPEVWLGVPLKTAQRSIGVVAVQSYTDPDRYSERDMDLLMFVSGHIAMAIERKRSDDALKASEERYRSLIDTIPNGLTITDLSENIIFVNPAACSICGYSHDELVGRNLAQIVVPEEMPKVFQGTELRKRREQGSYELIIKRRDGQLRTIMVTAAPLYNSAGEVKWTIGIFSDVTEFKNSELEKQELREKLARAQRMESLGVLAGGVAHDLNNILGPLVAYPELIRMKLPADSPTTVHISKIEKSAQRAAEVVQDLLTMARRGRYEMCPIKLNKIVDDYLQSPNFFDLRMRFPLVSIETELADSDCFVYGSEPHLYKVIMNLVINALDAMPHGGKLKIRTECQYVEKLIGGYDNIEKGRFAILTVSDTGIGIDKKDYKRIFEPFYTKKEMGRSGSGLGLAIVYGVIKDHNGYIDIQSELDKGSYFVVYLPIMENAAALQDTSILNIHGSESILIVDDVAEQRELAATVLASLGYKVDACANGHEAAEYLKRGPVDVVILDMIMEPGFDGLDTYRKIIELRPGQKAIITSGFSETGRVREAEKLGVGKYVRKPYTMQQLGRAIREVLAK